MSDYEVTCPHPDCAEVLIMTWSLASTLAPDDLAGDLITPDGAHSYSWQVECTAGHVLLLPGPLGCPCEDDQGSENCPHDEDLYDWSEDYRTFKAHDYGRLREVLHRVGGEPS